MQSGFTMKLTSLFLVLLLVASLMVLNACSPAGSSTTVNLEAVLASTGLAANGINAESSYVVRSSLLVENKEGLTIAPTKTKSAKITTLIFIDPTKSPEGSNILTIFLVPVTGNSETEFNMAKTQGYSVPRAAADNLIKNYGLTYSDWMNGAVSGSDKFPCCQ